MKPTKFVQPLRVERGLHLVRYGGGDDMREGSSLLHFCQRSAHVTAENRHETIARVQASLAVRTEEERQAMPLPSFDDISWSKCEWDLAVYASSKICGSASSPGAKATRANLFHQVGDLQISPRLSVVL